VPFLYAEPFYFDMVRRGIELYEMPPSGVLSAAENGAIDAGPVPLVDCFRLEDRFQPMAGFCVACLKQAGSTFLYSSKPIDQLHGAHIGITDEASTAPQLLHVLLRLKYQVQPAAFVPLHTAHDAFLLIGNRGLRQRKGARGFPYLYDLGEEWHAWTDLPFVFSRWMVRKDADPKDIALLEDTLYVGLEEGVNTLYRLSEPREDLLMLPRDVVRYIQGLHYYIGLSEQRAIDLFRRYLKQLEC
jgi:chorismate dehydratase